MRKIALLIVFAFIFGTMYVPTSAMTHNNIPDPDPINLGARTTESYVLDSPHYYSNNYDHTWTVTKAGASKIRVYFQYLRTENSYDYVYIYDKNWNLLNSYTGSHDNTWSSYSYSDTIYVRLKTDYSVTYWGFRITYIDYDASGADTTAPTVSITSPSNGATVSGTVTISCSASDANGISSQAIKIDGTTKSTSSTYTWDTTAYSDGSHTIYCEATDPSGNTGSDQVSVTVDNSAPSNVLSNGVPASGSLATNGDFTWQINVDSNAISMHVVLDSGSNDFDFFASHLTSSPSHSNNEFEGYTYGGEDVTFNNPAAGVWYINVDAYSGSGAYTITVTITYGSGSDWGNGGKYAVVWGISDYQYINDLSYCDEDASDVYNFLVGQGYEVKVFGDSHSGNYPVYNGLATEDNVRGAIQSLAQHAQAGDNVVVWASSHGGAMGTYAGGYQSSGSSYAGDDPDNGYSYLLMYDFSTSPSLSNPISTTDESYSANEMRADFESFAAGVHIFLGIDACQSGGFGWELSQSSYYQYWYITMTAGVNGYGYDQSSFSNGAFTYWYIEKGVVEQGNLNAHNAFVYADNNYNPSNPADDFREYEGYNFNF